MNRNRENSKLKNGIHDKSVFRSIDDSPVFDAECEKRTRLCRNPSAPASSSSVLRGLTEESRRTPTNALINGRLNIAFLVFKISMTVNDNIF